MAGKKINFRQQLFHKGKNQKKSFRRISAKNADLLHDACRRAMEIAEGSDEYNDFLDRIKQSVYITRDSNGYVFGKQTVQAVLEWLVFCKLLSKDDAFPPGRLKLCETAYSEAKKLARKGWSSWRIMNKLQSGHYGTGTNLTRMIMKQLEKEGKFLRR
jgi:hypothetical protein